MLINAVDLFCGVGGLTKGVANTGINVIAGIDLDIDCKYAYTTNNQSKFIHASVSEIKSETISSLYPKESIKILMGCAPCQPFSTYNNKKGKVRHKDWFLLNSFAEHIKKIQPDVISMENVPSLEKEGIFQDFLNTLKENNYFVSYEIVNAADYGVPQRRRRLLLLASKYGKIKLIAPTHKNNQITVKDAIGNLDEIKAGEIDENDMLHTASSLSELNLERIKHSKQGGTWRDWPQEILPECYKKQSGSTYSAVYGRMCWDDVAPTLTTQFTRYGTGRYGHPTQNRAISLREGAILQSFPIDYKFTENINYDKTKVARHIGNAVPVKLGEAIGESIKQHLKTFNISP